MTLEAENVAPSHAGWRSLGLAWLAFADNLRAAHSGDAATEAIDVPQWPRSRIGSAAFFAAAPLFVVLTVVLKDAPGPGWMLIAPVYLFLAAMAACVALPRRA